MKIGISLGNVCYSAQYGVENKLRETKKNGYNTCPFDLMISNYNGVIECIKNDFQYFCDPEYLMLTQHLDVINSKYNFIFNHETPGHADLYLHENWPEGTNHFINNNFKHFIDRYQHRIQSFRNYLNDTNNEIVFIIQFKLKKNPNDDCVELREVLKTQYPNLNYSIIILE